MWAKAQLCLEAGANFGAAQVEDSRKGVAEDKAL